MERERTFFFLSHKATHQSFSHLRAQSSWHNPDNSEPTALSRCTFCTEYSPTVQQSEALHLRTSCLWHKICHLFPCPPFLLPHHILPCALSSLCLMCTHPCQSCLPYTSPSPPSLFCALSVNPTSLSPPFALLAAALWLSPCPASFSLHSTAKLASIPKRIIYIDSPKKLAALST